MVKLIFWTHFSLGNTYSTTFASIVAKVVMAQWIRHMLLV